MTSLVDTEITRSSSLTSHLTGQELEDLTSRIQTVTDEEVQALSTDLFSKRPFIDDHIWNPERFEDIQMISYKAYSEESISLNQFVTCSIVSFAFEQFQARFLKVRILSDWHSRKARQTIATEPRRLRSRFTVHQPSENRLITQMIHKFITSSYTDRDLKNYSDIFSMLHDELGKRMEEMPPSEKLFFSYRLPLHKINEVSPMLTGLIKVPLPFLRLQDLKIDNAITIFFHHTL